MTLHNSLMKKMEGQEFVKRNLTCLRHWWSCFPTEKRAQLFMRAHDETLPVAVCVCDGDCSPVKITVKA